MLRSQINIFCQDAAQPVWNSSFPLVPSGFLDIWRAPLDLSGKITDPFRPLLDAEEIRKANSFYRQEDKLRYLTGRGFLRKLAGNYLNRDPRTLVFSQSPYRKPILKADQPFHFNLSHAGDWVVIALSSAPVGIDIEPVNKAFAHEEVVSRFFEASEKAFIAASPSPKEAFFKLWTRKEAFLKGIGLGLSDHLQEYCLLDGKQTVTIAEHQIYSAWRLESFRMRGDHWLSIASSDMELSPRYFDVSALPEA
ncbi:4'-phosphopantetheinyl transferase [Cyclobacterium lianum]|uniref:4'-phosphopantetheinyl transferase n=1 Tax=Cyclobacterium lianum TaxID=388280 RepID=A0A1M7I2W6_9BACT|nr:4'-phosphopantetheinyl transferase superfamily protein [Cyclobacterium lianum]SHM34757.1 4'-phosphopantetheinyl transferase [Cyclobacterium lianum]